MFNKVLIGLGLIIIIIFARIKIRGYFWVDKKGKRLNFREFRKRLVGGISNSTPLQQTKVSLISFCPMFTGIIWGIAITFIGKTYWLTLILSGSLPLTTIQFIGTYQRYKAQKIIDKTMKEMENDN